MAGDLLDLSWFDGRADDVECAPTTPLTTTTTTTARADALVLPTNDVRFCTSCKHHLESEFFKPGRRTCSACLALHRSHMRWKRRRETTGTEADVVDAGRGRPGARARKGARVTKTRRANASGGDAEGDVDSARDTSK